jgi:predicted methyltransferase
MAAPLLTRKVHETLRAAARAGLPAVRCSLDLDRSTTSVEPGAAEWTWQGERFPYLDSCKDRTIYHWVAGSFQPLARFSSSLIKLVPTEWGPPTFEIDGIKMLPTARVSPYADAGNKVALIEPRGKVILDACGGLGYFAAWCLLGQARQVLSYEKNADVIWLRGLNPWSPETGGGLSLTHGDIAEEISGLPGGSVDAILHDPPRFGIAGELYSLVFYNHLARVLKRKGKLFHYTGMPNKLSRGRDLRAETVNRLRQAGFATQLTGDGVLAVNNGNR